MYVQQSHESNTSRGKIMTQTQKLVWSIGLKRIDDRGTITTFVNTYA